MCLGQGSYAALKYGKDFARFFSLDITAINVILSFGRCFLKAAFSFMRNFAVIAVCR